MISCKGSEKSPLSHFTRPRKPIYPYIPISPNQRYIARNIIENDTEKHPHAASTGHPHGAFVAATHRHAVYPRSTLDKLRFHHRRHFIIQHGTAHRVGITAREAAQAQAPHHRLAGFCPGCDLGRIGGWHLRHTLGWQLRQTSRVQHIVLFAMHHLLGSFRQISLPRLQKFLAQIGKYFLCHVDEFWELFGRPPAKKTCFSPIISQTIFLAGSVSGYKYAVAKTQSVSC